MLKQEVLLLHTTRCCSYLVWNSVVEGKRPLRICVSLKSKLLVVASAIDSGIQIDPLKAPSKINCHDLHGVPATNLCAPTVRVSMCRWMSIGNTDASRHLYSIFVIRNSRDLVCGIIPLLRSWHSKDEMCIISRIQATGFEYMYGKV
jgi:hypothetical protein